MKNLLLSLDGIKQQLENLPSKLQEVKGKEIFTVEEAAEFIDVTVGYLYKLTSTRKIPHYNPLGKKLYFKKSELEQWILASRVATEQELIEATKNVFLKGRKEVGNAA